MATPGPTSWSVFGEAIAVWLPWRGEPLAAQAGVKTLGRRVLVTAANYEWSPAGPYCELAVLVPARLGGRVGFSAVRLVVDSPFAREAARATWGAPAELARLGWHATATHRRVVWEDRKIDLVATLEKAALLPIVAPVRALQRRADGNVVVNGVATGRVWRADVQLSIPSDDPLGDLAGRHRGRYLEGFRLRTRQARRPVAGAFSLRAPLLPVEGSPGMSAHAGTTAAA